jgi:hypothetical protein
MPVAAKSFFIIAYGPRRAMGRMSTLESSGVEMRGSEPSDMLQHQSPPPRRGEVRSRETCGSTGAHLRREARSRIVEHAAVPKPT